MSAELATPIASTQTPGQSLVARMAARFGVDPAKMMTTLKATAFKGEVSNEQMMGLLIVAEQYHLNPWVREIFAFPDKNNGIVPVVSVDGWSRIINENPQLDGIEFQDGPLDKYNLPEWIECIIHRKDRQHPTRVREYMAECKRSTGPWGTHPRRMLRHKAMIQCARVAFAFSGIYDEDEAKRIVESEHYANGDDAQILSSINKNINGASTIESDAILVDIAEISRQAAGSVATGNGKPHAQPEPQKQPETRPNEAVNQAGAQSEPDNRPLFDDLPVPTAIDAIAAFAKLGTADTLDEYMNSLPDAVKSDQRVVQRFKERLDELKSPPAKGKK